MIISGHQINQIHLSPCQSHLPLLKVGLKMKCPLFEIMIAMDQSQDVSGRSLFAFLLHMIQILHWYLYKYLDMIKYMCIYIYIHMYTYKYVCVYNL